MAGETESGCLSLHNLEPPAHVILELLSPAGTSADDEVLTRTSGVVKTGKCIHPKKEITLHYIVKDGQDGFLK